MRNCVNCGAPLRGGTCEYCGTVYEKRHNSFNAVIYDPDDEIETGVLNDTSFTATHSDVLRGKLTMGGRTLDVYVNSIVCESSVLGLPEFRIELVGHPSEEVI
jgi:hypothetical protein